MRIIKEGTLPENEKARGLCKNCGCCIEDEWGNVPKYPNGFNGYLCPTTGCGRQISMTVTKWHLEPMEIKMPYGYTPEQIRKMLKI